MIAPFTDVDLERYYCHATNARTFRAAATILGDPAFGVLPDYIVSADELAELCQMLHRFADRYGEPMNELRMRLPEGIEE